MSIPTSRSSTACAAHEPRRVRDTSGPSSADCSPAECARSAHQRPPADPPRPMPRQPARSSRAASCRARAPTAARCPRRATRVDLSAVPVEALDHEVVVEVAQRDDRSRAPPATSRPPSPQGGPRALLDRRRQPLPHRHAAPPRARRCHRCRATLHVGSAGSAPAPLQCPCCRAAAEARHARAHRLRCVVYDRLRGPVVHREEVDARGGRSSGATIPTM